MTNKSIYGCAPVPSSIDNRYHYVYRITNLVEGKHYYGSRTSSNSPMIDLGTKYFGSPSSEKNRWIVQDQKDNQSHYKYKILRCFETRKEATGFEVFLHKKFDVKSNQENFYNVSNQTSSGFDTTNTAVGKGLKWYVDPLTDHSLRCNPGTEPIGYVAGTSKRSKENKSNGHKKLKWYHSPDINKEASYQENMQPVGWIQGRLPVSNETKEKLSKIGIGRIVSEETREKQRKASTGRSHNTTVRQHLSEIAKNFRWYHNPITREVLRLSKDASIPHGYIRGRGPKMQ